MPSTFSSRLSRYIRHPGIPARVSTLILLWQRSPLVKLLPEFRIVSTSGFSEALKWSVTCIAGLGAFDSIAGASEISQVLPSSGSLEVNAVAGESLTFMVQATGTPGIPASFQFGGDIPPGLIQTGLENSRTDFLTGVPTLAGTYNVTVTAWELPGFGGDFIDKTFTFNITNPPLPAVSRQPAGGNFTQGSLVHLSASQTDGKVFTWKLNDEAHPVSETLFFPRATSRRYRAAPAQDPGQAWFTEAAFDDNGWASVSGALGYDTVTGSGVNFLPHIASGGNLQSVMSGSGKPTSVHLRMPFTLTDPAVLSFFKLRVQCDDGFVAWLNGTEIAAQNKPASLQWNSAAGAASTDATAVTFREFNIPQHLSLLRRGDNLLAVQALNRSATETGNDFLFNCELAAGINATNSPWLLLTSLSLEQSGNHTLTVTNPAGSVTTGPAAVLILPEILSQPEPVTISHGQTGQLNVTPGGSPPFSYQWYRGLSGNTADPVPGAEDETFVTPALTETTSYWVRISSAAGMIDSVTATVTVVPPAVDSYSTWVTAQFPPAAAADPNISGPGSDPDQDGFSNQTEYIFGTPPLSPVEPSSLNIDAGAGSLTVSFTARRASGPGYNGRTRLYSLESSIHPVSGLWLAVEGFAGIAGNNQTVSLPVAASGSGFYRLRVELTP